ncbi:MAG TPA: hypothetical protein VGB73_13430 [Pyrinomonadaceae bacterium]
MSSLYAMQRANGDWFALDNRGRFRVPVFSSHCGAMLARVNHWEMQLFKPVIFDEVMLEEMVRADGLEGTDFWMVDDPFTNFKRGRLIERAQLSLLVRDAA